MGWDAFAEPFNQISDDGDPEWRDLAKRVGVEANGVDGLLRHGGLDCSACAMMLERATGEYVWSEFPWDSHKVQILAQKADWSFEIQPEQEWAKQSAKAFLEHAAQLGKSIRFSF